MDLEERLEEAVQNIQKDRAVTSSLLIDLMTHMKSQGNHVHESCGLIASKYVETLQRSNEQLVKIAAILQKNTTKTASLSGDEKNEIFDLIQGAASEEKR
jgi:hypothetical protein